MDSNKIFKLWEPQSEGSEPLPLIFDSPHSGAVYPEDFGYTCDFDVLKQAEDHYVDDLFSFVPKQGAALLAAEFPRSYIDVNRAMDDIDPNLLLSRYWPEDKFGAIAPTHRSDVGIGLIRRLVKPGVPVYNRTLEPEEITKRIENYYKPYHRKLEQLLDMAHYNYGAVWYINCHSMPDSTAVPHNPIGIVGRDKPRSVDFCLGDRDGTTANIHFTHMLRDFLKGLGYKVSINDPFKGVELVRRYGCPPRGRTAIQIEINKALYMDEESGEKSKNFKILKGDLEKMVVFITAHIRKQLVQRAAD